MERFVTIELKGMTYKVSSLGKIYSKRKELKQRLNRDGYLEVTVGKTDNRTTMRVHRIILMAFDPRDNMEDLEVNHKDYNRTNNKLENLEWITHAENVRYSKENHRNFDGEKNPKATFTERQVKTIRAMYKTGWTINQIVYEIYGVTRQSDLQVYKNLHGKISDIVKYRTWKHIA